MGGAAYDPEILSANIVDELISLDQDGALLPTLLAVFRSDSASRLKELANAIAAQDEAGVARAAHGLRGIAASVGAKRAHAIAGQIEDLARAHAARDDAALARELEAEVIRAAAELQRIVGLRPPT